MSEKNMWQTLAKEFKQYGDWQRIENLISMGMPDVNYCIRGTEGWIELKEIPNWPKRKNTSVKFRWTKEQRFWARRRGSANGTVWLLLRVVKTREWLLYWWKDAVGEVGLSLNKREMLDLASFRGSIAEDKEDFIHTITRGVLELGGEGVKR